MRFIACLERADIAWCAVDGIAVNHWADEPMVTKDFDFVVASSSVARVVELLTAEGFRAETFPWSVNFTGGSKVSIQLSTEETYSGYPARSVPAEVHGILLRVACLEDTLAGKVAAWMDPRRRQSKRLKDLGDICRLVEAHPLLWSGLPEELRRLVERP